MAADNSGIIDYPYGDEVEELFRIPVVDDPHERGVRNDK
jgi:hypothetical protein